MKKSIVYLLSIHFDNFSESQSVNKSFVFADKNIAVDEFYRNFHNILPDVENRKNKSVEYLEKYAADKKYEYIDKNIVVDIEVKEIEYLKFSSRVDYINAQMSDFPGVL